MESRFYRWLMSVVPDSGEVGEVARFFRDNPEHRAVRITDDITLILSNLASHRVPRESRAKVRKVHRIWRKWQNLGGEWTDYVEPKGQKRGAN